MIKYKRKVISQFKLKTRKNSQNLIKSELDRYKKLTEEQFKLRLLGMEIELSSVISKRNSCDYYLGSLTYLDNNENLCWVRIDDFDKDLNKKTYNNVLENCIIKAKEIIEVGNFLIRKKVF